MLARMLDRIWAQCSSDQSWLNATLAFFAFFSDRIFIKKLSRRERSMVEATETLGFLRS